MEPINYKTNFLKATERQKVKKQYLSKRRPGRNIGSEKAMHNAALTWAGPNYSELGAQHKKEIA